MLGYGGYEDPEVPGFRILLLADQRIENPCVGGSIPPRATKITLDKTPTHAVGVFVSEYKQSSGPVHFRAAACFCKLSPLLPLPMLSQRGCARQSMFRTDTTGTLTLSKSG
jgi:hypothetical protein